MVLFDASASMEVYSRVLLPFVWAVGRASERFEAFAFGTRLTRVSRPLRQPGYQPLTRGLQAALPFVDDFLPVRDLASLEDIVHLLADLTARRGRRVADRRPPPGAPSSGAT